MGECLQVEIAWPIFWRFLSRKNSKLEREHAILGPQHTKNFVNGQDTRGNNPSMEARLYLHIGPPKTASTTLQSAIQSIQFRNLAYGGVYQPRKENAGSLAQSLQLYTDGRLPPSHPSVISAINEIEEKIKSNTSVFISEEMFLLSEVSYSFTEKLRMLSVALQDIPTTVLFTVRDPLDAIPSLYQEIFAKLPISQQLSFRKFTLSEYAKCFDYQRILNDLSEVGFKEYRAIDFNCLVNGNIPVSTLFGNHLTEGSILPLPAMNVGNKVGNGRALPRVSLKKAADRLPLQSTLAKVTVGDQTLAQAVSGILDSITLRRDGIRELFFPKKIAMRLEENYKKALELCVHTDEPPRD